MSSAFSGEDLRELEIIALEGRRVIDSCGGYMPTRSLPLMLNKSKVGKHGGPKKISKAIQYGEIAGILPRNAEGGVYITK